MLVAALDSVFQELQWFGNGVVRYHSPICCVAVFSNFLRLNYTVNLSELLFFYINLPYESIRVL